jgi:hypothetical protein
MTKQDKTRQSKVRQHKARQDNTKQDKTTQSKTSEKNGEGFAPLFAFNFFYVDGVGWVVCGGVGGPSKTRQIKTKQDKIK